VASRKVAAGRQLSADLLGGMEMSRGTLRLVFLAAGLFSMAWFWLFGPWLVAGRAREEL